MDTVVSTIWLRMQKKHLQLHPVPFETVIWKVQIKPYEWSGYSQQSPYEPGRMDDDKHLKVFLQSVEHKERHCCKNMK